MIADHYRRALTDLKSRDHQAWDRNLFDALFIDEGQDLEPDEYRLLTGLVRPSRPLPSSYRATASSLKTHSLPAEGSSISLK